MKRLFALCLSLCLGLPALAAGPVSTGDRLSGFSLADQHGAAGRIDEATTLLLFSRDMKANKLAKQAFLPRPGSYLPTAHAAYAIDVSGMPRFVTNTFAIPKMQKYGYPILLDREGNVTASLPSQKGMVTLIHLDALKVTGVEYASSADALTRAVDAAAAGKH